MLGSGPCCGTASNVNLLELREGWKVSIGADACWESHCCGALLFAVLLAVAVVVTVLTAWFMRIQRFGRNVVA